jgi:phosphatidylinositol glycan class M
VWFFSLLPLVVPRIPWPLPPGLKAALGCWVLCQLHWLFWAYLLEFQGLAVHLFVWFASILFLGANTFLIVQLLRAVRGRVDSLKEK